ncbi:MAG: sigma 54-interacting transcriptional regulator, partial [Gemmataceae bacterium]|nr:sigma 54-interacting transcriptional regulator [Gemmataceae bacterium]
MPERLILLVSSDRLLIETVRSSSADIDDARVCVCSGLEEARARLDEVGVRLVLIHLTPDTSEADTEGLLRSAAARHCKTGVLSDEYRDQQAVRFLRAGAADYLGLPVDLGRLSYLLEVLTVRPRQRAEGLTSAEDATNGENHRPLGNGHLLSQDASHFVLDPGLVQMMDQLRRVVARDTTLLFTGETGTGKTRLARLIHELSPRRDQPFLVVDCGALSASLIE